MHIIRCHNNSQSNKYSYTTPPPPRFGILFRHTAEIGGGGAHFQKNVQMNNKQDKFKVGVDQC